MGTLWDPGRAVMWDPGQQDRWLGSSQAGQCGDRASCRNRDVGEGCPLPGAEGINVLPSPTSAPDCSHAALPGLF